MKKIIFLFAVFCSSLLWSQEFEVGNMIPEYGKTFEVKDPGFKTDTTSELKIVFDINRTFNPVETNQLIETAARFLNMHEKAGVDPKNMKVAVVLHGRAVNDALKNEFYTKKNPDATINPTIPLIDALSEKGVEIILCGQSAAYHKVSKEKADENVIFSLSALTALVQLQNDGYQLIKF
ncbi:MAG: DsrE family protein [Christiangramia sp.]